MGIFSIDETIVNFSGKDIWKMLNEKQKEEIADLMLADKQNNILTKLSNICNNNHICENCCLYNACEYLSTDMHDFIDVVLHDLRNDSQ